MTTLTPREEIRALRTLAQEVPNRVHLIGHGRAPAIPANELQPGDILIYNYGETATVESVEPKGRNSLTVTVRTHDGSLWPQTKRGTTLVPIIRRAQS